MIHYWGDTLLSDEDNNKRGSREGEGESIAWWGGEYRSASEDNRDLKKRRRGNLLV